MVSTVHIKTCEVCGALFLRPEELKNPYCKTCSIKLKDFPTPDSQRRRGRPARVPKLHTHEAR